MVRRISTSAKVISMKIAILGGSTTIGKGDPKHGGWAGRLRTLIESDDENNTVFVLGIPGESSDGMKGRISHELNARDLSKEDICIIVLGMNDSRKDSEGEHEVPITAFKENCSSILDVAREHTDKILVIGPAQVDEERTTPFKGKHYLNDDIIKYAEALRSICKDNDAQFIAMHESKTSPDALLDGLHPTPEEHERRAKIIEEVISEMM